MVVSDKSVIDDVGGLNGERCGLGVYSPSDHFLERSRGAVNCQVRSL